MAIPFHTFIWKTQSRCNLNCTYCFVYNRGDTQWELQPATMSNETSIQTAKRIREHCEKHNKKDVKIIFHGGEPLMGGVKHLSRIVNNIREVFEGSEISVKLGMQSNGLLFTKEIGEYLLKEKISIGISIDGPPKYNDIFRVDHNGRGSSKKLEESLKVLTSDRYKSLFCGFLVVINIEADPIETFDYLVSLNTPLIDFIYPYDNYNRLPPGKKIFNHTPYAEWLIKIYDKWTNENVPVRIRHFDSILSIIFGGNTLVETLGLDPVDIIVVETNGDIEAVDSLKAVYDGATKLGFNVYDQDFDTVSKDIRVLNRQLGIDELCDECKDCPIVKVCGGGYIPCRYSVEKSFCNPSIYCKDHEKLIRHIYSHVTQNIDNKASGNAV